MLVINQLSGKWRINNDAFRASFATCRAILAGHTIEALEHVAREHNTAADAMANHAADGRTMEVWGGRGGGPPPPRAANAPAPGATPDIATCLLGILPISKVASINGPTDWFQVLRLSVLDHLNRARSTARVSGTQTSRESIRRAVFRDVVRELLVLWEHNFTSSPNAKVLLRAGSAAVPKALRREDFTDFTTW